VANSRETMRSSDAASPQITLGRFIWKVVDRALTSRLQ